MSATNASARPAHHYLDFIKPRRGVAIVRLKNNGLGAVVFFVVTILAPGVPSPLSAFATVFFSQNSSVTRGARRSQNTASITSSTLWAISVFELLVLALLTLNIAQSCFALRYPPAPCNTPSTPSHLPPMKIQVPLSPLGASTSNPSKNLFSSIATPSKPSGPSSTYQPSPTPSSAYKLSLGAQRLMSPATSPQQQGNNSPFNNSFSSSFGSSTSTPFTSPLAYRSARGRQSIVRPVEGSLLRRLSAVSQVDDDDGYLEEY